VSFHVTTDERLIASLPFVVDDLYVGIPWIEILRVHKRAHDFTHMTTITEASSTKILFFFPSSNTFRPPGF
jgi:hypothetical protein